MQPEQERRLADELTERLAAEGARPAFEAARYTIDRLKEVVPIWKKEFFEGGAVWIGDQAGQQGTWENAGDEPGKPARDTGGSGEPA